jgi:hypothetical protein
MIHQKDGRRLPTGLPTRRIVDDSLSGLVGKSISHYAPKAHPPLADEIIEKSRTRFGTRMLVPFYERNGTR